MVRAEAQSGMVLLAGDRSHQGEGDSIFEEGRGRLTASSGSGEGSELLTLGHWGAMAGSYQGRPTEQSN